jgi:chitinase
LLKSLLLFSAFLSIYIPFREKILLLFSVLSPITMHSSSYLALLAAAATHFSGALAGFDPASKSNFAAYWGQGSGYSQTLEEYCANTEIDIFPVAFLVNITNPGINLAATSGECSTFDESTLLKCPTIGRNITSCQDAGKTVLLSIGGSTYSEGGWNSTEDAIAAAQLTWATFGPKNHTKGAPKVNRPFKRATVNGFDLDFEASVNNSVSFANELRRLIDEANNNPDYPPQQPFILTAAPQCPYPDANNNDMLNGTVSFDALMIQFYNNVDCDLRNFNATADPATAPFNMGTWNDWAKVYSANKDVKLLIGAPGANDSAPAGGYVDSTVLKEVIAYAGKNYDHFGGLAVWQLDDLDVDPSFLGNVTESLGLLDTAA